MLDERDHEIGGSHGGGADQGMGATVLSLAQGLGLEFVPLSALLFLDARDIGACGAANRFLHKAAGDEGVWRAARDRLWEGKVFVPESSRAMRAKEGYIASLRDSKRTWLHAEELTSFSWWFRFKQQAGEAWTAQDPWYRNEKGCTSEPASSAGRGPTLPPRWGKTTGERWRVLPWRPCGAGAEGGLQARPHGSASRRHVAAPREDESAFQGVEKNEDDDGGGGCFAAKANISWRFVGRTGRRTGPTGSFLRVSIGGREVPTYIVSRHRSNWGFLLESCWTVYTSWEMPPREGPDCDQSLLDDKLTVTMDDQWEERRDLSLFAG
ncbi:conserved unknown protein [Ectocarpus siliculosus]|uniref:F-box domain-containing protein n=1 Tax=Ectocarpus siliculosus TaxID=2880 RepID=D8LKJ8_ECTSI|nr:conserved unknown protein [Ectocarpus siliculosus]|eukprot:CBN74588.1 conserved unknown protein [Ectocarpus siliculosus]